MNEMQVFQNSEFGELGVLELEGKPYFPATACAKILGYAKPHNAISQHCRYSLKQGVPHPQNPSISHPRRAQMDTRKTCPADRNSPFHHRRFVQ